MATRNPIVYVRGFAGGTGGINKAVDDPLYGFNEGSTHVRVGSDEKPQFFQFEGPILRLIGDGYNVPVHGSQHAYLEMQPDDSISNPAIWVHRFYDPSATTWSGEAVAFHIETAAADLFELVQLVLQKSVATKVDLVAHSMGGLICRSMIQKVIPDARTGKAASEYVDRFFTYATPHGGIDFSLGFGILEKLRDLLNVNGADIFGPDHMYEYLTPLPEDQFQLPAEQRKLPPRTDDWKSEEMPPESFPLDRIFCLVGTNPDDYDVALGLSAKAVGTQSDGLVQISDAFVVGAPRAFAHRSHSGRYGIVNSQEGYENLRRFLFGDLEVRVELANSDFVHDGDDVTWQLETILAIRGLPSLVNEQTAAHHCPIAIERRKKNTNERISVLTTYLDSTRAPGAGTDAAEPVRYALTLRIISLRQSGGFLTLGRHLEQTADFDDALIVDYQPRDDTHPPVMAAKWNSLLTGPIDGWTPDAADIIGDHDPATGVWTASIPFPLAANGIVAADNNLVITVTPRS